MSKEKELVKNTAIITAGRLCTQFVSFLLLPLYTAILSTEEYGTVDLVITYSTLLLPFVTLALEQALFRFLIDVRGDNEKISEYISTVLYTTIGILFVVTLVLTAIYLILQNFLLIYFTLVLIAITFSNLTLQICRGLGDNLGYSIGSSISAICQVVCNVVFLVYFKWGAPGMMLASFTGNVVCAIVCCFRCRIHNYFKYKNWNKETLKTLTRYSLPLIPNQLSWWALNASDRIIVQMFIGVAGNGLIAVANKFSGAYIQFSTIFNISWSESATLHFNDVDAEEFFNTTINSVYRLFLSACCGIIVCMPFAFPIMVNSQFAEAYNLIPIFMIASLFNVIVSLYGVIYVVKKKTVEIAKTAMYAALLNVISHLALIYFCGIYAAAISTAIGYGGMAVYRYFHSRKYMVVKFTKETILISIVMLMISIVSYYSNEKLFQLVAFLVVLFICLYINKDLALKSYLTIKNKLFRKSSKK